MIPFLPGDYLKTTNQYNQLIPKMDNITNEIERPQRWGALAAGCGDAPKYLTELKNNISLVREIASQYCTLTIKDKNTRV